MPRSPRLITLVGCCAGKLDHPAPARDLYQSPLFRLSLAHAEQLGAEVFILSALHGLVGLAQELEPYDLSLADFDAVEMAEWARVVGFQLGDLLGIEPGACAPKGTRFVLLAGQRYRPEWPRGCHVEEPLRGMGIGRRLAWLRARVARPQEVTRAA